MLEPLEDRTVPSTVTGLSPASGPAGGGGVAIYGTNFTGASAVTFGGVAASEFDVMSATEIMAEAPAHAAGVVDISVTTAGGTSATSAYDHFTYNPPPPTAVNDSYTLLHDHALNVAAAGVLANDTSPGGLPLSAVLAELPEHGSISLDGDGSFVYTPNADYVGTDEFGYYAVAGGLGIDPGTGTISGTLGATNATGVFAATVTASDGTLSASQGFSWFVADGLATLPTPADQTNTEGDAVSLQLQGASPNNSAVLTYTVSGLPAGLTYNASTGLISGTVAVGAAQGGFGGDYTVTAYVDDGSGNNAGVRFDWTVAAEVLPPTLADPGNQTDAEGQAVSLQLLTTDPDGDPLTYTASGLPPGLSIDPDSGLISGDVSTDAALAATSYTTTVAVYNGSDDTLAWTFQWAVTTTNQPPWLTNPLMQFNTVGDPVHLQIGAGDADGDALTYSAGGLPPGLGIDPHTGLIQGNLQQAGSYNASVSVTDGVTTLTQQFGWSVTATAEPTVTLDVNGTPTHTDDVALLGAAPIPVVVTLHGDGPGLHEVDLQLPATDGGRAEMSQTTLWLANGGSATVWLTALQASAAEDDTVLQAFVDPPAPGVVGFFAGEAKLTIDVLTYDSNVDDKGIVHVRAADTPVGMADRIPPRKVTNIGFTLSVALTERQQIDFKVDGQNTDNGEVNFVAADGGSASTVHTGQGYTGGRLALYGEILANGTALQTVPGHAGNLHLVAYVDGTDSSKGNISAGFSVAAIPYRVIVTSHQSLQGVDINPPNNPNYYFTWGTRYAVTYHSDSNDSRDLDQVAVSEQIRKQPGAKGAMGAFLNDTDATGFQVATSPLDDDVGIGTELLKQPPGSPQPAPPAAARVATRNAIRFQIDHNADGGGEGTVFQFFVFTD